MPKLVKKYSNFQSVVTVTEQQLHALLGPCQQEKTLAPSKVRLITVIQTPAHLLLKGQTK